MRIDLRNDLLHAGLLRTYPLRGTAIVAAEIAGSTLVLTAMQFGLLVLAAGVFPADADVMLDPVTRVLLLLAAPLVLLVLNATTVMLKNGAALLFPEVAEAWGRVPRRGWRCWGRTC